MISTEDKALILTVFWNALKDEDELKWFFVKWDLSLPAAVLVAVGYADLNEKLSKLIEECYANFEDTFRPEGADWSTTEKFGEWFNALSNVQ